MESRVLTTLQRTVLFGLFENGLGDQGYYLTGGTALAEFYLQHRYSDDLDLFTRKRDSLEKDFKNLREIMISLGLVIASQSVEGDHAIFFAHPEHQPNEVVKIEFARDTPAMMDSPGIHGPVLVDSFEDIAVNKICTILSRHPSEPKDFCDLFFILNESRYSLEYLIGRAHEKEAAFDGEEGVLAFATNLLNVREFPESKLRMIKPLRVEELKTYLVPKAEAIIQRLRPKR